MLEGNAEGHKQKWTPSTTAVFNQSVNPSIHPSIIQGQGGAKAYPVVEREAGTI